MAADGISVNTTLSQASNVARTQAKGQANQTDPAAASKTAQDDKRVDRVKQTEETDTRSRVDPDERRQREQDEAADSRDAEVAAGDETEEDDADGVGRRLDTRA